MKQCPKCKRTYADDLTFCLDDGSILSDLYIPGVTLAASADPTTIPTKAHASPTYQFAQPIARGRNQSAVYVVVALLALLVGAGIVALLRPGTKEVSSNEPPPKTDPSIKSGSQDVPPSPPKPARGSFEVYATSPQGTIFTNPYNKSILVEFRASGQWTFWPNKGLHSAAGYGEHADRGFLMPSKPEGALIVRRGNGSYEYIGDEKIIRVEPNEPLVFVMNDDTGQIHGNGFADNKGSLDITWECQDCKQ